jgi:hypothetical protein
VEEDILAAVREKQRRDDSRTAELISRGTPAAPVRMGVDGGMNETFLAAVRSRGGPGATIRTAAGTIPAHAQPPAEAAQPAAGTTMSLASADSRPAPAPRSSVQVASAGSSGGIGGFFSNLFGSRTEEQSPSQWGMPVGESASKAKASPAPAKPAQSAAKPVQTAAKPKSEALPKAEARSKPDQQPSTSGTVTAFAPQPAAPRQEASAEPEAKPASTVSLLNGAAPTVPAGAFENRFGAWR